MNKEIKASDTVEILAHAYQLSQKGDVYPLGPYTANVNFRVKANEQSPGIVIRLGDIFSFDDADRVDIRSMISAGLIAPYEGDLELKDGW